MAVKRLDAEALKHYALRLLGGRAYSGGELRDRLRRRAEKLGDVEGVLSGLKERGYIDDRRYAETFAEFRRDNEGLGRARVLSDLRGRRVAPAVAEQAVKKAFAGTDEIAAVEQYLRRKFRRTDLASHLAQPKNLASAYRRLRYAGFSSGVSIRVLKRFASQAEDLEALEGDEGTAPSS